jgi:hypothetical protein
MSDRPLWRCCRLYLQYWVTEPPTEGQEVMCSGCHTDLRFTEGRWQIVPEQEAIDRQMVKEMQQATTDRTKSSTILKEETDVTRHK